MFFIQPFFLYEYINGKMKDSYKLGYGVVFPNNKTVFNMYSTDELSIYKSFEEFSSMNCKGNRSAIFMNVNEIKENPEDE